jgi:endonuclease YncB( thermonuclease family)
VEGDPFGASAALAAAIAGRDVGIERLGRDRYGRTLANIYAGGRNVACDLIRKGTVRYVAPWDKGGVVAAQCAAVAH